MGRFNITLLLAGCLVGAVAPVAHADYAYGASAAQAVENHKRELLQQLCVRAVDDNARAILGSAYPLAFGALRHQSTEPLGVTTESGNYIARVRLNYLNLLGSRQYLEMAFKFDSGGNFRSHQITDFSDFIAPHKLTLDSFFRSN